MGCETRGSTGKKQTAGVASQGGVTARKPGEKKDEYAKGYQSMIPVGRKVVPDNKCKRDAKDPGPKKLPEKRLLIGRFISSNDAN